MDFPEKNKDNLVTLRTEQLRDRLNRVYNSVRGKQGAPANWNRFDYLWDLKELAVLERRGSVQIPDTWLDELEKVYVEAGDAASRGH